MANADGTGAHQVSPVVLVELQSNVDWRQDRFHASPLGEQIQASAYIVNRDGSLRLLYPNLNASQIAWGPTALPTAGC